MSLFLRIIIAAGGQDGTSYSQRTIENYHESVELLHFDEDNSRFKIEQSFELPMKLHNMGFFVKDFSLYLTGGFAATSGNRGNFKSDIYKIECNANGCSLETLDTNLKHPNDAHISLPIPSDLANC